MKLIFISLALITLVNCEQLNRNYLMSTNFKIDKCDNSVQKFLDTMDEMNELFDKFKILELISKGFVAFITFNEIIFNCLIFNSSSLNLSVSSEFECVTRKFKSITINFVEILKNLIFNRRDKMDEIKGKINMHLELLQKC